MNMIYENRRKSASNDPFVPKFLWLLCCVSLPEKCWFSEFFWCAFSRIWTEYLKIVPIPPYSVMQENTDQKKIRIPTLFICASVHYSITVYTVTILEVIKRKTANTAQYASSINRQSV